MKSPRQHLHAGQKQTTPVLRYRSVTFASSLTLLCIVALGVLAEAQAQTAQAQTPTLQAQAQAPNPSTKQVTAAAGHQNLGVAAIEAYCKELDGFKKRNPNRARFFGDVSSWDQSGMTLHAPAPKWKEFKSRKARESANTGDNLYDVADVWIKDEKVVLAEFWFGSPSGDWSQSVIYYFRDDGTLAKMQSTYAGFNLNPFPNREEFGARLVQTRVYDANGKRLRKSLQCFELGEKGRQRKCSGDYSHHEGAVYLKVQRLPLYKVLNSPSPNAPPSDVASVEAYCKNLDLFTKRNLNRARIFGNIVSPNQETYPVPRDAPRYWEAFPTRKARESAPKGLDSYDGADVWLRNGKVVVARFEPNRYFYGGERVVTYYFRADGSLAKTRIKFFDYGVDGDVVKEIIYDVKGNVLQTRMRCIHVAENGRRSVVNCSRMQPGSSHDASVYRRVEELPFNDLLKAGE